MRVLCVCLGNICRSPAAESVLRALVREHGLPWLVDSAGTSSYHQGDPADERMLRALTQRGYPMPSHSRQVVQEDFRSYDLILAMDHSNLENLRACCPKEEDADKIRLFCQLGLGVDQDVPDPYYGDSDGFVRVLNLIERCSAGLIERYEGLSKKAKGEE